MLPSNRLKILLDASVLVKNIQNIKEKEQMFNDYIKKRGILYSCYFIPERNTWRKVNDL